MSKTTFQEMFLKVITSNSLAIKKGNYLFFDVETIPEYDNLNNAPENYSNNWCNLANKKYSDELKNKSYEQIYYEQAALYPEFNKICCLSAGRIVDDNFYVESLSLTKDKTDEKLIQVFCLLLQKTPQYILSGFNINNFDIGILSKKAIKYGISIPKQLNIWKWKPWERPVFDIFDFWKQGNLSWPSLENVSGFLNCGNPKDNMHGNEVKEYYYVNDEDLHRKNLDKIVHYCEGDVISTMCIFNKLYELDVVPI